MRATLDDLRDQIREAESKGDEMRARTEEARIDHRETLERIAKLDPSLAHVEDYLRGKFTHFAFVESHTMHVKTMEEAPYGDEAARRQRLDQHSAWDHRYPHRP